jgi:hypothetical protein
MRRGLGLILTLQRDEHGKYIPASKSQINALVADRNEILPKRNSPADSRSVLQTAIQGMNEAQNVSLEEIGL